MKWLSSAYQPATWIQHGVATIFVSVVFSILTATDAFGLVVGAWMMFIYYLGRETADEYRHKKEGDWYTPDEQGITPLVDKVGDLLGPGAVALTYSVMYLMV